MKIASLETFRHHFYESANRFPATFDAPDGSLLSISDQTNLASKSDLPFIGSTEYHKDLSAMHISPLSISAVDCNGVMNPPHSLVAKRIQVPSVRFSGNSPLLDPHVAAAGQFTGTLCQSKL